MLSSARQNRGPDSGPLRQPSHRQLLTAANANSSDWKQQRLQTAAAANSSGRREEKRREEKRRDGTGWDEMNKEKKRREEMR
jgi:hypothetical protein